MLLQRLLDEGPVVDDVGLSQHVHDVRTGNGDRLLPPVRVERVKLLPTRGFQRAKVETEKKASIYLFRLIVNKRGLSGPVGVPCTTILYTSTKASMHWDNKDINAWNSQKTVYLLP